MANLFKAFQIGMQILTAIQNVKMGEPAELAVEYKGKLYRLRLTQETP